MILDPSALIAILDQEPDADIYAVALERALRPMMSAPSLVEATVVAAPRRRVARLDALVETARIEIVAFTDEHADAARTAYARYGKGSGSPARLDLGDCFSYALAQVTGQPLLFKGDDFTHTDIRSALAD